MCLKNIANVKHSLKQLQDLAEELGGYDDLTGSDILNETNRIYGELDSIARVVTEKSRTEKGLPFGLNDDVYQRFYQGHHLAVFLAVTASEYPETVETINSETLSVVLGLVADLTNPKQLQRLNSGK